jgi:UrcA family protein
MNYCKLPAPLLLSSVAAGLLWLAGAAPAAASSPESQRHVTVRYDDLNLATVSGATELYGRIRSAAGQVCGEPGLTLGERHAWEVCVQGSITDAANTVGNPIVSALAAGRDYRAQIALSR